MDGFKVSELQRMQSGGNKAWQDFFNKHKENQIEGRTFEASTIKDRYDSEVGEEWKERLSAKVEGREYVPGTKSSGMVSRAKEAPVSVGGSRSQTPVGRIQRTAEASPARSASPLGGTTKKEQNEAYFAKMGSANSSRPDDLPPSQGGKYGGFGSGGAAPSQSTGNGDWFSEMGKDPIAGLTKGFGWLGKSAKTINEAYVKPNVQKVKIPSHPSIRHRAYKATNALPLLFSNLQLAEADLATTASRTAFQLTQTLQSTTKVAADSFNQFVEGSEITHRGTSSHPPEKKDFWDSFGEAPKGPSAEKKDFWDSFGGVNEEEVVGGRSAVGTAAMKKAGGAGGGGRGKGNGKDDEWGDW